LLLVGCVVPSASGDDDTEQPEAWDPTPPDVADGATFVGALTCGLFEGTVERRWVLADGRWDEQRGDAQSPREEVVPCLQDGDKVLDWLDNGDLQFLAGGWNHDLAPSTVENLWTGDGTPVDDPFPECLDGLGSLGLTLPVPFALALVELILP
jgi:hypothetical protein